MHGAIRTARSVPTAYRQLLLAEYREANIQMVGQTFDSVEPFMLGRKVLLTINILATLVFTGCCFYVIVILPQVGSIGRIVELDRAQVFDTDRLQEYSDELAENLRYNVGLWVAERERQFAFIMAIAAALLVACNAMIIAWCSRDNHPNATYDGPERFSV